MEHQSYCDFELAKTAGLPVERFPETLQEGQLAEDIILKGLEKLSLNQHERILFEVHGLSPDQDEDGPFLDEKFQELDKELDKITIKEAFDLAREQNPSYVHSPDFRLMFLRCHQFDGEKAALAIVQHFHVKQRLFGNGDVLSRDICQSDLSPTDKDLLGSGFLQVLPERDAAGRTVLLILCANVLKFPKVDWDVDSELRLTWYVVMTMIRDEQAQTKGVVVIVMNHCAFRVPMEIYTAVNNLHLVLPQRFVAGHYCYTDPDLRPYVAGFQLLIHEKDRYRMKTHFGTLSEIFFELQTFGIPTEALPLTKEGSCCNDWHEHWLALARRQEELPVGYREETIIIPRRFDVLLGKRSEAREHTGTMRALHVVEMYFEEYEKLGKYQKTEVAEKIIRIIHESEGRFLKQTEHGAWIEVDDTEARKKIAHWFRHARFKRQKQESYTQQESSSTEYTSEPTDDSTLTVKGTTTHGTKRANPACVSPT